MKIYGIEKIIRIYDYSWIEFYKKLFVKKEDADAEMQKMIEAAHENERRQALCDKCRYEIDYENCKKNGGSDESFISKYKHKRNCSDFSISVDKNGDREIVCGNTFHDLHEEYEIKEYELIFDISEAENR